MIDLKIPDDLVELYESSKLDTTIFVGSEIRELIGRISRLDNALNLACRDVAELKIENAKLKEKINA